MLLSSTIEDAAKTALGKLPEAMRATIQNSSVKLKGTTARGLTFTGSGVILFADDGTEENPETIIVTAKHNLYIYNGNTDQPAWDDAIVTKFTEKVKIYYDTAMTFGKEPTQEAAISSIQTIDIDAARRWSYDVMILKSTDAALHTFATTNGVGNPTALFTDDKKYIRDPKRYLKREEQVFFQTGFGKVTGKSGSTDLPTETRGTGVEGKLQFRVTKPLAEATTTVHNQRGSTRDYDRFDGAVQLDATANSTTAPGDSGGPIFVASYNKTARKWKLFLIGVSTGADMNTSATPCPPSGKIRVNNIAASLETYYNTILG